MTKARGLQRDMGRPESSIPPENLPAFLAAMDRQKLRRNWVQDVVLYLSELVPHKQLAPIARALTVVRQRIDPTQNDVRTGPIEIHGVVYRRGMTKKEAEAQYGRLKYHGNPAYREAHKAAMRARYYANRESILAARKAKRRTA